MKLLNFALSFAFFASPSFAATTDCRISMDPSSVQVAWTAFKTTEKVAVSGSMKELEMKGPKRAKTVAALLAEVKASGKIDSDKKSDTGNPARDLTLFQKFFQLLASHGKYEGAFSKIKGTDEAGELNLDLRVNGKKKAVPMKYVVSAEGNLEATGEFDMEQFGMQKALASIHQSCEALHTGKDGVSKTWPTVGLKITGKIMKECAEK